MEIDVPLVLLVSAVGYIHERTLITCYRTLSPLKCPRTKTRGF